MNKSEKAQRLQKKITKLQAELDDIVSNPPLIIYFGKDATIKRKTNLVRGQCDARKQNLRYVPVFEISIDGAE